MTESSEGSLLFECLGLGSNSVIEKIVVEQPTGLKSLCHHFSLSSCRIQSEFVGNYVHGIYLLIVFKPARFHPTHKRWGFPACILLRRGAVYLPNHDLEVACGKLYTAFLAFVAEQFQNIIGRPQIETRIESVSALDASDLESQIIAVYPVPLKA